MEFLGWQMTGQRFATHRGGYPLGMSTTPNCPRLFFHTLAILTLFAHRSLFSVLLGIGLGCASPPAGPAFAPAAPPPEHRSRIYLYRVDPRSSLASVDLQIDGREIGRFRDSEYETIEVAAGPHHLKARMRGFAFVSMGWNEHRFRTLPGEALYLEVSVRLAERSIPNSPSLEIAGRSSSGGSENVYLIERGAGEALDRMRGTSRIVPD